MTFADGVLRELMAGFGSLSPGELESLLEIVDQVDGDSTPSAQHQRGDFDRPALLAELLSERSVLRQFLTVFVRNAGVGGVPDFNQVEA